MPNSQLLRTLIPDGPLHKRTDKDLYAESVQSRTDTKTGQAPLIFQGGNCLIGDDFWLLGKDYFADSVRPTFGHGRRSALKAIDDEMKRLWASLGFSVHALGDFNAFAERQGVVHCIKKYLRRGN